MKHIIVFDNAEYTGRPEWDFYRFCLGRQPGLLRYFFAMCWAGLLYCFRLLPRRAYYERCWRFLRSVRDPDARLERFWQKHRRGRVPTPEGEPVVLLSCHPFRFLAPMARSRGAELWANEYDTEAGVFPVWLQPTALWARCGGDDALVYDRLRSPLREHCAPGHFRPTRRGRAFDTPCRYRRHLLLLGLWTAAVLLLAGIALGAVSLYFATANYGIVMFLSYFRRPVIALLNILPVVVLLFFFYFLTNRTWLAFTLTSVITVGLTLGNYFKISFRSDPLFFEDMIHLVEAAEMGAQYHIALTPAILVYLLCCAAGVGFCLYLVRGRLRLPKIRLAGLLVTVLVSLLLYQSVYTDRSIYREVTRNEDYISPWSENQVFFSKGFLYPFLHSIQDSADHKPEGYDEDAAAAALAAYGDDDIPAGEKVNIIAIMLEAYNDFSTFEELEFKVDVYEVLHALQAEGYSGQLVTNIFAGGTIDTERCFLTGFSELSSFRQYTNSYAWYFREQGYYATGAHGCFQWFYNRQNINEYLGLQDYKFVENYYAPVSYDNVAPDYLFLPSLIDLYEAHRAASDAPYFSFNVSYQGHGPYSAERLTDTEYIVNQGYTDAEFNILNNYFDSVYDTNQYLSQLFDYFRACEEPVVIVLFGDHNPWLGDGASVYRTLGIDLDPGTEEGFYNYYCTPYLIWGNDAAKAATGSELRGEGGSFSPCFLMNELFDLLGWEGNAFMKASNELRDSMDVVNTTGIFREDGALTLTLSDAGQTAYDRYKILEYYWRKNFQSSLG